MTPTLFVEGAGGFKTTICVGGRFGQTEGSSPVGVSSSSRSSSSSSSPINKFSSSTLSSSNSSSSFSSSFG
ncbi:MAG TPA: hypothetical protein DD452_03245 [Nitrospina sp.]|nr:hypothetical protein [Nitrospina sp.]